MTESRSEHTVSCEISDDALQGQAEKEKLQISTPDLDLVTAIESKIHRYPTLREGPPLFPQSAHFRQARLGIVSSSGVSSLRDLSLASAVIGLRGGQGWRAEGGESGFWVPAGEVKQRGES